MTVTRAKIIAKSAGLTVLHAGGMKFSLLGHWKTFGPSDVRGVSVAEWTDFCNSI